MEEKLHEDLIKAMKEKDKETHQAIIIPLWTFGNN